MDAATKKAILGKAGKILVGGPSEDKVEKPKFEDDMEPCTWHFSAEQLYEEVLHSFGPLKAVVNATCADHNFCLACVKCKIPVVGVVMTEEHKGFLETNIKKKMWSLYQDEESVLFQAGLHGALPKRT